MKVVLSEFVTQNELTRLVGISSPTMTRLVHEGKIIPDSILGRRTRLFRTSRLPEIKRVVETQVAA